MRWSEQDIADLKQLWKDGNTARQIGMLFGCSRNSVLGKVHRLGLEKRRRATRHGKTTIRLVSHSAAPKWMSRPAMRPVPGREVPMPPTSRNVSLLDLEPGQCKWPHGSGPYLFCGAPAVPEKSYCPFHQAVAYAQPQAEGKAVA